MGEHILQLETLLAAARKERDELRELLVEAVEVIGECHDHKPGQDISKETAQRALRFVDVTARRALESSKGGGG